MRDEWVVVVDEADRVLGRARKLDAHRDGLLHRAFSIFLFNAAGELLLQRRAATKYHSGGLWTNTCCGHPRPGEPLVAAGTRRLTEEMGLRCALEPTFSFLYRTSFADGLMERELDHVLVGRTEGPPRPDPAEADAWRWARPEQVLREMRRKPDRFTYWFRLALPRLAGVAPGTRLGWLPGAA